jgi:DNA (cytosine-5)-methyltransferase 1
MDCLDLFSGAGGLSLGLAAAGFNIKVAIDIDPDCCRTYAAAHPTVEVRQCSTRKVDFSEFRGIDLIVGGPPCQPFSSGGKQLAGSDQRDMIPEFIRAISEAHPRAFLMENVPGLNGPGMKSYFEKTIEGLQGLGYSVVTTVLSAAGYGVPQKRRRLFIVGLQDGEFTFPPATHGPTARKPFVPSGSVLRVDRILGDPNPSKIVYAKKPDLRPSPYDGHLFNGGGRPIDLNAPCHTILAAAGGNKTHFLDTLSLVPRYHAQLLRGAKPRSGELPGARRLTVEESALIQTFPKGMKFDGARSSQYTQVGNAVPPVLAKVIGRAIEACFRKTKRKIA